LPINCQNRWPGFDFLLNMLIISYCIALSIIPFEIVLIY
jgi:hypothetical protein